MNIEIREARLGDEKALPAFKQNPGKLHSPTF